MKTRFVVILAFCAFLTMFCSAALATELMPSFGTAPAGWATDRYAPAVFAPLAIFEGKNDVLEIGVSSADGLNNRPVPYQSVFYNTQGKGYALSGGVGDTLFASLWVPQDWATNVGGNRRTDMWGVGVDSSNSISAYPILGFTNSAGAGTFQYWDSNGSWTQVNASPNYGAWNDLEIKLGAGGFEYYVNGALVGSDLGSVGSIGFSEVIMQAYNFNGVSTTGTGDYSAYWANSSSVPEPGTYALMGIGLASLALLRRKSYNKQE